MNNALFSIIQQLELHHAVNCKEKAAAMTYLNSALPQIISHNSSEPIFLCIAGIPGVGKSEYIRKKGFSDTFVVVDPDSYRKYAPGYYSFSSDDVVEKTKAFVDYLSTLIITVAIYAGSSICIPSTFCATHFWTSFLNSISSFIVEKGYRTELLILDQPKDISFQSFIRRAVSFTNDEPIARKADISFFNDISQRFCYGIHTLIKTGFFSSVTLLTRMSLDHDYINEKNDRLYSFLLQGDD